MGMRAGAVALVAAFAVAVAACSSSGSSGSADGGTSGGSAVSIRLMVDTTMSPVASAGGLSFPYSYYAAEAAAASINAAGGVNGHKLIIDVCDNKADPNQSAVCGRQAAANKDIAVIGAWDVLGAGQILPVLQAEGIPYIGPLAANPAELLSPISFLFDPGPVVANLAVGKMWATEGCKSVVYYNPLGQGAAGEAALQSLDKLATGEGIRFTSVDVTIGQPDVSAVVSSGLAARPDCVSYLADAQTLVKLLAGLRQAGYKGQFITTTGALLPPVLADVGSLANGVKAVSDGFLPSSGDPMVKQMDADLSAHLPASQAQASLNEFGQVGWSSVQLIKQIFATAGNSDINSAFILKKLPTMCDVNVGNFYPHVNFCQPVPGKAYTRVFNPYVRYVVAEGGKYEQLDSEWHDVASAIPA